mmetsp:Transcript_4407/g.9563  ORF Transcript_4407/g.9563 Transcript_4407/m.9563 type:complete len:421 (+) Transcript_4407:187-1449(+)
MVWFGVVWFALPSYFSVLSFSLPCSFLFLSNLCVCFRSIVLVVLEFPDPEGRFDRCHQPHRPEAREPEELGQEAPGGLFVHTAIVAGDHGRQDPPPGQLLARFRDEFQALLAVLAVARVLEVPIEEALPVRHRWGERVGVVRSPEIIRVPGDPPEEGGDAPVRGRGHVVGALGGGVAAGVPFSFLFLVVQKGQIGIEKLVAQQVDDPDRNDRENLSRQRRLFGFRFGGWCSFGSGGSVCRHRIGHGFRLCFRCCRCRCCCCCWLGLFFRAVLPSRQNDRPRPAGLGRYAYDSQLKPAGTGIVRGRPWQFFVAVLGRKAEFPALGGNVGATGRIGFFLGRVIVCIVGNPKGGLKLSRPGAVFSHRSILPLEKESRLVVSRQRLAVLAAFIAAALARRRRQQRSQGLGNRHVDGYRVLAFPL